MASSIKNLVHGHGLHRSTTYKKPKNATEEAAFNKRKEEDKHFIAQWDADVHHPLTPAEVSRSPEEKKIGSSSKHLTCSDFKMEQIVGTGTFAKVWLVRINNPQACDKDKIFAMKVLRKYEIVKLKQIEHVENERSCLAAVAGHPFINTLVSTFQDPECLYMILDYCPGGEIFSYLRRARRFPEATAQFYAAEVLLVFEFLHETQGVAYRDLKPENILVDADGHLKVVDFGFAKKVNGGKTYTLCGTPEYLAPETIKNSGHGPAVDWWAFGILIFEFLVGQPPFWDRNPMKIYEQIVRGHIKYPSGMSADAQDLIGKLCQVDQSHRLGNLSGGAKDVRNHPWFKNIDFDKLYKREIDAPIKPQLSGPADTRNFDYYEDEPVRKSRDETSTVKKHDHMFSGF